MTSYCNYQKMRSGGDLLEEVGVYYSFSEKIASEISLKPFVFKWSHSSGKSGLKTVYCFSVEAFYKLLLHWNCEKWCYNPVYN